MDIIITTPKSEMAAAAREAADVLAAGGGAYFRRFATRPPVEPGDRIYYVEDGYVRGFALAERVTFLESADCNTTGLTWSRGWYVFMDATTWRWIRPILMMGFQNWRRAHRYLLPADRAPAQDPAGRPPVEIIGGWRDPKPPTHERR